MNKYFPLIIIACLTVTGCSSLIITQDSAYYSDDDLEIDIPAGSEDGVAPKPIHSTNAVYPTDAMIKRISGKVEVKMLVMKDGSVKRAKVYKTTDPIFNESALEAAMEWKFIPSYDNGVAINAWVLVPFTFILNK